MQSTGNTEAKRKINPAFKELFQERNRKKLAAVQPGQDAIGT